MNTKTPSISIITPVYNGERFIWRLFDSVLANKYSNIQHIVVDDGSTDGTKDIIFKYQKLYEEAGMKLEYYYQPNAGIGAATNECLKHVQGEWWTWINCDDWYDVCFYTSLVNRINQTKADCLLCNFKQVKIDNEKIIVQRCQLNDSFKCQLSNSKHIYNWYYSREFRYLHFCIKSNSFRKIVPSFSIFPSRKASDVQFYAQIIPNLKCEYIDTPMINFLWHGNNSEIINSFSLLDVLEMKQKSIDLLKKPNTSRRNLKLQLKLQKYDLFLSQTKSYKKIKVLIRLICILVFISIVPRYYLKERARLIIKDNLPHL